tara:strand:+ start:42 stop:509 length:468 start_codon:yes stop_codon:yes gene_type:complete
MAGRFVGFGKKLFDLAKKPGEKSSTVSTIVGVSPKVNKTKLDKAKSKLAIQQQKTKASGAKLKQTLFESKNKAFKGDDFTFATTNKKTPKVSEQKAKGGRVGLRLGTKRKSNVEKIKKTFGTLSVRAGIDNNPNPTYADKIAGAKMKKKKKKKII